METNKIYVILTSEIKTGYTQAVLCAGMPEVLAFLKQFYDEKLQRVSLVEVDDVCAFVQYVEDKKPKLKKDDNDKPNLFNFGLN